MFFKVIVAVLALCVLAPAFSVQSDLSKNLNSIDERYNNPSCKCINWRHCHGDINSDVSCPQSYLQVCCVMPNSEAIPQYEDIQVVQVQ